MNNCSATRLHYFNYATVNYYYITLTLPKTIYKFCFTTTKDLEISIPGGKIGGREVASVFPIFGWKTDTLIYFIGWSVPSMWDLAVNL